MSWGTVTADGRRVGYNVRGRCEHPGCRKRLMLGLDAACGGMHGAGNTQHGDPDGVSCAGYFCDQHLTLAEGVGARLCFACAAAVEAGKPSG